MAMVGSVNVRQSADPDATIRSGVTQFTGSTIRYALYEFLGPTATDSGVGDGIEKGSARIGCVWPWRVGRR